MITRLLHTLRYHRALPHCNWRLAWYLAGARR
jgi:hypothetical protein